MPIVLQRLKQKLEEWKRVRLSMKNQWRRINELNYPKSLDHRSFYFKQDDKKRLTSKALVSQLREINNRVFGDRARNQEDLHDPIDVIKQIEGIDYEQEPLFGYCIRFKFLDPALLKNVDDFIYQGIKTQINSEADRHKVGPFNFFFWKQTISPVH